MMTPTAKKALSSTIRALRERLVTDLDAALERAYLLQIPLQTASLDARTKDARQRLEAWLSESPEGTAHARREVVPQPHHPARAPLHPSPRQQTRRY